MRNNLWQIEPSLYSKHFIQRKLLSNYREIHGTVIGIPREDILHILDDPPEAVTIPFHTERSELGESPIEGSFRLLNIPAFHNSLRPSTLSSSTPELLTSFFKTVPSLLRFSRDRSISAFFDSIWNSDQESPFTSNWQSPMFFIDRSVFVTWFSMYNDTSENLQFYEKTIVKTFFFFHSRRYWLFLKYYINRIWLHGGCRERERERHER